MKTLLSILVLSISLNAGDVWKSKSGKAYHKSVKCMTLARTAEPIKIDSVQASKTLKPCGICYRKLFKH